MTDFQIEYGYTYSKSVAVSREVNNDPLPRRHLVSQSMY